MTSERGRVTVEEGVVFGTGGGRDLKCDVFAPPDAPRNAPAVLLVHGGAWRQGDRAQLRGYGILLGREGFVCVASDYRLTGESRWPAQIHDVKAAIRWMRANSDRLGIDPAKIAVRGNSAGAHLALLAAGTPNVAEFEGDGGNDDVSSAVAAAIGIYRPTLFFHGGKRPRGGLPATALMGDAGTSDRARAASPITYVNERFPPTLLIHGTADETVPPSASLRMYKALVAAAVPVELHMYADQPHGFDAARDFGRQCAAEMRLFLSRYVGVASAAASAAAAGAS